MSAEPTDVNRVLWDARAAVHGQDAYYDSAALVAGKDSLTVEEEGAIASAVGDVAGLEVVHVQCHIGHDTISLARRGARVTGIDFSTGSLAKAAVLAEQAGVEISWVHADARDLPVRLHASFDLA